MEWARTKAAEYYTASWRWVEDTYLRYFGENRTSYGIKDSLHKAELTGNTDVDGAQRSASDAVGDAFATGHVAGGVGDVTDRGVLRGNV